MDLGVPWPRFHGKRDESNQFILVIVKNSIANDNLFKLEPWSGPIDNLNMDILSHRNNLFSESKKFVLWLNFVCALIWQ